MVDAGPDVSLNTGGRLTSVAMPRRDRFDRATRRIAATHHRGDSAVRRAARAAHITSRPQVEAPASRPQSSGLKAGLIGAGIAIAVVVIAVVVLVTTGVL